MQGEEILEMFYEQIERPRLSYHTKSAESANRLTHMIYHNPNPTAATRKQFIIQRYDSTYGTVARSTSSTINKI